MLSDRNIPVHGDGQNIRDWIHVTDHNIGVDLIVRKGKIGETYNLDVLIDAIIDMMNRKGDGK